MAANVANGLEELTPAARLAKAHDESHQPSVEEVVDEEDLAHPPPTKAKKAPAFDVQNEELFPSLGSGPAPKATANTAWGAPKAAAAKKAPTNGFANGPSAIPTPPLAASRTPTPASSAATPAMKLPGQKLARVHFTPEQILPRDQLKKPLNDIVRDLNKRSRAKIELKHGANDVRIFEAKGPTDESTRQALRDLAKQIGTKLNTTVPVPASSRAHIIGKGGSVIQAIGERTGARIQVPRPDGNNADEDDLMVNVQIEGDAISAEMARQEILNLVKERSANVNMRLKSIPSEYFPFISGANNARINELCGRKKVQIRVPEYTTWSQQPPAETSADEFPVFQPSADRFINISGDREAALEAQAELEALAEELRRQITLRQLAINRGQHQFIIGNKSSSLNDFLAETGCAVILPPDHDDTEFVTITGPVDQIEAGVNKAMDLATSMQMASVDLSRQHLSAPSAQAHARALSQYFQRRRAVEELERLHDSYISLPKTADGPVSWEVFSRDGKNTIKARSDILNLIQAHPPSRVRFVDVDPFFHQRLQSQEARLIQDEYGVHLVVPDEADAEQIFLVFEGPSGAEPQYQPPRQRPSSADQAAFEEALVNAQKHILELIAGQGEIVAKTATTPNKFSDKLRRFIARDQESAAEGTIPVRAVFGDARGKDSDCPVKLRGPAPAVDALAAKIAAFVEEQNRDELERDYTISFDYPKKFVNFLIGKQGEHINKLREEFDVEIKLIDDNNKVEIKGPEAKANAAKSRILNMAKKLEDEKTHVLKIPAQFHREIIGSQGAQVNKMQDKYHVRIQFPRSGRNATVEDDVSVAGSDDAPKKKQQPQQGADEVIIRGPSKGADDAKDDLFQLFQFYKERSNVETVSVAQSQIPALIGARGREMEALRTETGAQIDVPNVGAEADSNGRVEIKIKGTKKEIEAAKKILMERVKVFDNSVTKTIDVDKKYLKSLIGGGGSNIRRIVIEAGGPDDSTKMNRMVRFPRADSNEKTITLEGDKSVVEKVYAAIEQFVQEREDQVTATIDVPQEKHRMLIGRGGETRRELESKFSVNIDIPKQGSGKTDVRIKGASEAVEAAKAHIAALMESQKGETVQVPKIHHHAVSDNGQFFRRLRSDLHVTVDHAGQQPPPKPAAASASRTRYGANGAALPLITDDEASNAHSWDIVDSSSSVDASDPAYSGTIPWILSGSTENVAKAKAALEKSLDSASRPNAVGYLILPDPTMYRHVIGAGGQTINGIRKKTGVKIDVPKNQAKNEAIEIRGEKEGLEKAKDLILEAVEKAGRN